MGWSHGRFICSIQDVRGVTKAGAFIDVLMLIAQHVKHVPQFQSGSSTRAGEGNDIKGRAAGGELPSGMLNDLAGKLTVLKDIIF
jgi:hypothetical protein